MYQRRVLAERQDMRRAIARKVKNDRGLRRITDAEASRVMKLGEIFEVVLMPGVFGAKE
jgi:hypothetical protein